MIKQDIIHSDDYWYHLSRLQDAQENKHSIQYKKVLHMEHNITNKFITIKTKISIPSQAWGDLVHYVNKQHSGSFVHSPPCSFKLPINLKSSDLLSVKISSA